MAERGPRSIPRFKPASLNHGIPYLTHETVDESVSSHWPGDTAIGLPTIFLGDSSKIILQYCSNLEGMKMEIGPTNQEERPSVGPHFKSPFPAILDLGCLCKMEAGAVGRRCEMLAAVKGL